MSWVARASGRLDEMSGGKLSLQVEVHKDGDIVVSINEDGMPIRNEKGDVAQVEFCTTSGGGGRSLKTRDALVNLLVAMIEDNRADPAGIPRFPIYLKSLMDKEK